MVKSLEIVMVIAMKYIKLVGGLMINGMIDGIPMGCLPPINGIYTWDIWDDISRDIYMG